MTRTAEEEARSAREAARDWDAAPPPPSDLTRIRVVRGRRAWPLLAREIVARTDEEGVAWLVGGDVDPLAETELAVAALAREGLIVRGTHFGRIEELRCDEASFAANDHGGATGAAIALHTDQPFVARPPRFQLLQCVRAAATGGELVLVDAWAAARHLASIDDAAEALLRAVPVDFQVPDPVFEPRHRAAILSGEGATFQVRYAPLAVAARDVLAEHGRAFQRAYDRFAHLVRDPRHQRRFVLAPGELVLCDNHRMLHARAGFRGARWLRRISLDEAAP